MMTYTEAYNMLCYNVCFILFLKKDMSWRYMLGTRNSYAIWGKYPNNTELLGFHDNTCSISNGNVAVFDLEKGESRCFNINRLLVMVPVTVERYLSNMSDVEESFIKTMNSYKKMLELKDGTDVCEGV